MQMGRLLILGGGQLAWYCPGCERLHAVNNCWKFDGNYEAPAFSPSALTTGTKTGSGEPLRCHCFIRTGKIEFLSDCSHHLAGKSVPMEDPDME